jgi:hypothetical protein
VDVPQLPRVAVVGEDFRADAVCATLVDSGLQAVRVTPGAAVSVAATQTGLSVQARHMAPAMAPSSADNSADRMSFEVRSGGEVVGAFDAIVVVAGGAAQALLGRAGLTDIDDVRFGGVYCPGRDGVYVVGGKLGGEPSCDDVVDGGTTLRRATQRATELAQARWLGEYLRGRYLLPERQEMTAHSGLRRASMFSRRRGGTRGYLSRLALELRRGRDRAAAAGYPLPLPSTVDGTPQPLPASPS